MCTDANAGIRFAAKQKWLEKNFKYKSEGVKFHNREAGAQAGLDRINIGFSRANSDAMVAAYHKLGTSFKQTEKLYTQFYKKQKVNEGGQSRTAQRAGLLELLRAKGALEYASASEFGRNMAIKKQGNLRKMQAAQAQNRVKLGVRPEYGAPVLMPPSDRMSSFLNFGLSVASMFVKPSDIKEKENIEYVGSSPQGHNIWEFNYVGDATRYRGAMAQEVAKINPMAVGIDQDGTLNVDYSKIDVDMEVV